jgi:DNA-binding transcriptional ArsR family regulator
MPQRRDRVDEIFKALADPTRRKVIERLVSGPTSTSDLAEPFDMALPSFTQHLAVLERAGLVTSTKQGRTRTYRLSPAGLDAAQGWLADQRRVWERRLDQLDTFLIDQHDRQHDHQQHDHQQHDHQQHDHQQHDHQQHDQQRDQQRDHQQHDQQRDRQESS